MTTTFRNIVLVGTKADLCPTEQSIGRRVSFAQAIELCKKLGLAGCLETSSLVDNVKNMNWNSWEGQNLPNSLEPTSYFDDLNDAFFMAACNCVDQTTMQI